MPVPYFPGFKIGVGHDAAPLTTVEELIPPTGERYLTFPTVRGGYNPGQVIIRGDGSEYLQGFASVRWIFRVMWYDQEEYLRDTYCGGDFDGKVTVRTPLTPGGAYARYNATIHLQRPENQDAQVGYVRNYEALLARMVAI